MEFTHTDKVGSVIWLLLAVCVYAVSADFPAGPGETGPAFYPRIVATLIAVFALVLLGRSVYREQPRAHEVTAASTKRVLGIVALIVGYVLALPWFGFLIATIAFLVAAMWYSGIDSYLRMGGVAIGLTLVLYYTFVVFLRVPLPESYFYPIAPLLPGLVTWPTTSAQFVATVVIG